MNIVDSTKKLNEHIKEWLFDLNGDDYADYEVIERLSLVKMAARSLIAEIDAAVEREDDIEFYRSR